MAACADEQARLPLGVALPDHLVHAGNGRRIGAWPGQQPVRREHLVDRAGELDPRLREDHEVIADPFEVGDDVRGEDHRHAGVGDDLHHRLQELPPRERVERGDGLVEQQELRPLRERERERHLGLLPAGELSDLLAGREAEQLDAPDGDLLVPARIELATELQRLADGEALVQRVILGDEADPRQDGPGLRTRRAAEHAHLARTRLAQPDRELQERRLSRSVRPDQRGDAARRDLERAVL